MSSIPENARATVDVGLDLLDRQLMDKDGLMAGKVDDLELTECEDGPPVLTAILAGPGALAPRLGRVATWVAVRRLRLGGRTGPSRIAFGLVKRIGPDLDLAVSRDQLDSMTSERWATGLVQRIPGSG